MVFRIHREGLGHLGRTEDLAHEFPAVPFCLPLHLRVVVLHLLAIRRQPRRATVRPGEEHHRLGLRDREMRGWFGDVANGVAHARGLLGISPAAVAPHTTAPAHAAAKTSAAATAT